ncbi:cation transporter [Flavobacterium capsici]|uniref:Cation transporter n=1 Tax=Flavobacterium capsici TaxID=3075618 RepID=A0AA96J6L9_9FLAO|nr:MULTISPECIES: cation transporter [unclassified Flavobacterium]WNM20326.1 cation transporter [Flavobacterium sp. PMR2A8]WNM21716.1 cation transporter [Flavobacterium sp. PMTSA4]
MKNFILLVFALLSFSVSGQVKKNQKAVIQTVFNCDHCKECETCGKNFQANLYKIKGLKTFEIDEEKMTITVYFNAQKTDLQAIKTAISKLGFDADEIKADETAYEKLDDCCKKA